MLEKLNDHLIGIALGIRFRANFSIEDQLGKLIDTILYSEKSYFNPKVFPIARTAAGARLLVNEVTQDRLTIDNSNVVLELNFDENLTFTKNDLDEILSNFETQIIKGVLKEFSIKEIRRVGYIRRYLFQIESLASSFIEKTLGDTFGEINDINLNFSRKIPTPIALVKKEVLDYDNVIFNIIKKSDLKEIFISVDYQSFFDPFLPSSTRIDFKHFLDNANNFNTKRYLPWLNSISLGGDKNE